MAENPNPDSTTSPERENLEKAMAEVKRLADALVSVKPQPTLEPLSFREPEPESLDMLMPQQDTMQETLFKALIDLFRRFNFRNSSIFHELSSSWPSFASELILRTSMNVSTKDKPARTQELDRFELGDPEYRAQLQKHMNSSKLWDLNVKYEPIDGTKSWTWTLPRGVEDLNALHFKIFCTGSEPQIRWTEPLKSGVILEKVEKTTSSRGRSAFGALWVLRVPIQKGILEFPWIEFIMAQAGFLNYKPMRLNSIIDSGNSLPPHLTSFMFFLGMFAGYWSAGIERARFSSRMFFSSEMKPWNCAQVHFRCFILVKNFSDTIGCESSEGLQCVRQRGQITSPTLGTFRFEERRISIFGTISGFDPVTAIVGDEDRVLERFADPSLYRVLILKEDDLGYQLRPNPTYPTELKCRPGWEGIIAFERAILLAVEIWEEEWNKVFDQIDDSLRFELDQTIESISIDKWMFDLDFERSRQYFTILQILRIFGEYIRTVSMDLRALDSFFLRNSLELRSWDPSPDELQDFNSNWTYVIKNQKIAEERIMKRLLDKTEEVKSLRDGLFNASSLREASRSTTMNRYVIIFTVVTVLYLPPSFVSTVFGMTIFQKDIDQTTREYKVTTVVVSLITYLVALISIIAVNWHQIKRKIPLWWNFARIIARKSLLWWNGVWTKGPEENNSTSVPIPPVNPTSESPASRLNEKGKYPEASNEKVDVESGINEDTGESSKAKSPWHIWRG